MKKIGVLSDTHGFFDPNLNSFFRECEEIWHAGDIGDMSVIDQLAKLGPIRAVFGNIDDSKIRLVYPEFQRFMCEDVDVFMVHIGGKPGRYEKLPNTIIKENPPNLFICGHSHILKVIYDKSLGFLYINPGAAGRSGLHQIRTAIRFIIDGEHIKDLEVLELGKRS